MASQFIQCQNHIRGPDCNKPATVRYTFAPTYYHYLCAEHAAEFPPPAGTAVTALERLTDDDQQERAIHLRVMKDFNVMMEHESRKRTVSALSRKFIFERSIADLRIVKAKYPINIMLNFNLTMLCRWSKPFDWKDDEFLFTERETGLSR